MDTETIVALIAAGLGLVSTVVIVVLLGKGVKSLSDIRGFLRRPPHDDRDRA